jgi:hypothetical protein
MAEKHTRGVCPQTTSKLALPQSCFLGAQSNSQTTLRSQVGLKSTLGRSLEDLSISANRFGTSSALQATELTTWGISAAIGSAIAALPAAKLMSAGAKPGWA